MAAIQFREILVTEEGLLNQVQPIFEVAFKQRLDRPLINEIKRELEVYSGKIAQILHVFGAIDGQRLLGFGISKFIQEFTYVPLFAVHEKFRSRGIGAKMAQKCIEIAKDDAKRFQIADPVLLFDLDRPDLAVGTEYTERYRRLNFFLKLKFLILDIEYYELRGSLMTPAYLVMVPLTHKNFIDSRRLLNYIRLIYSHESTLPTFLQEKYLRKVEKSMQKRLKIYKRTDLKLNNQDRLA